MWTRPELSVVASFVKRAAVDNFSPLTVGLQPARLGGASTVVGVIVLGGWVAAAVLGRDRADVRGGVTLIVGMWLLNFGMLAYGRLGINGAGIADDLQYHVDAVMWFLVATASMLSASRLLRGLPVQRASSVRSCCWRRARRLVHVALGAEP